jgi:filamentous hemagglutinin
MLRLLPVIKKSFMGTAAVVMLLFFPATTFADSSDPSTNCTPPTYSDPGVHHPVGSDANTFTYNCTSGLWENAHYTYDPATNTRAAKDPAIYTYNDTTGNWDTTRWDYSAATGQYVADTVSVPQPPAGAITVGGPPAPTLTADTAAPSDSNVGTDSSVSGNTNTPSGSTVSTTGTSNLANNNSLNSSMNNGVLSLANSGNASVTGNTTGGDATSGNTQVIANVINMLQSTSNVLGDPNLLTFTANINGNINGDLLLDPAKLGTIQPASNSTTLNNNVTVNNTADASMNNNVALASTSGNADVSSNTSGGNATSGNANAVANIVNTLNSAINAGQSFLGVININGNLNGDILLPPNFVDQLLASNVPHATIDTTQINNNINVANNVNQSINNSLTTSATSGSATVAGNTAGGNATTGTAGTNVTVFNLTGSNIIGSNDLLVFVNVQGKWVGMILNAPAGSTAAELGGGISNNTTITNNADITNKANQSINNNINVASKSGDASVTNNTSGGNATSGNAFSSVNLMNMINDNLSLNNWFGLLFINVFGTWNGSFGVNTAAGDPVPASVSANGAGGSPVKVFQFVPTSSGSTRGGSHYNVQPLSTSNNATGANNNVQPSAVLAAHTDKAPGASTQITTTPAQHNYLIPAAGVALAVLLLASEKIRFFHRSQA